MPRQYIEPDDFSYKSKDVQVGDYVRGRSELSGNFQGRVTDVKGDRIQVDGHLEVEANPTSIEDRLMGKPIITSVFRD